MIARTTSPRRARRPHGELPGRVGNYVSVKPLQLGNSVSADTGCDAGDGSGRGGRLSSSARRREPCAVAGRRLMPCSPHDRIRSEGGSPSLPTGRPNADMWATAEESREQIVNLYQHVWAHSDATIDALALDTIGHVPWWPQDRSEVTLHEILVHMISETDRHAGHADIVRELIDGAAGLREGNDNMAPGDPAWWESYRSRLERAAQEAASA